MTNTPSSKNTPGFYLQSILSFGLAFAVVVVGEVVLPVPPWTRAFLAIGTIFLVSATFTLAKCVRDEKETESVVSRIDRARIERMLAEYDPYSTPSMAGAEPVPLPGAEPVPAYHQQPNQQQQWPAYPIPAGAQYPSDAYVPLV